MPTNTHITTAPGEAQFPAPETPRPTEGQGDALEVREAEFEAVDETPFFAPVASDLLDSLLGQYQAARRQIDQLGAIVNGGELGNVVHYFIEGNAGDDRFHRTVYVEKLFLV